MRGDDGDDVPFNPGHTPCWTAARLTDTLEHVDLAADRRRYYLALLRYTAQQTEGERPRVFDE